MSSDIMTPNSSSLTVKTSPEVVLIKSVSEKQHLLPPSSRAVDTSPTAETYLYLGFGSNLAKSTFEGTRKVRPLAQVNVHVPDYELTFDLPGIAYVEPCFGNSRKRVSSGQSKNDGNRADQVVLATDNKGGVKTAENLGWKKGLVGTVYEVSASDYKHIIETEGAGSSYVDTLVIAWPIPAEAQEVPDPDSYPPLSEQPVEKIPDLSKPGLAQTPFLAHTLVAPLPSINSHLFREPNWAQPSSRYLSLIQSGARERGLPEEYIKWLDSLVPFSATSWRQKMGKIVFMSIWYPIFILVITLVKLFVNDRGQAPSWISKMFKAMSEGVWLSYDTVFKPLAGEGERTLGT